MRNQKVPSFLLVGLLSLAVLPSCKRAEAKTKGVGDKLRAFIIKDCEANNRYCQVCAYGGKPTLMGVIDIEKKDFKADLQQMQRLMDRYQDKGLTAFALFGRFDKGKFVSVPDEEKALKQLKKMRAELALKFPLTVLPATQTEDEKTHYPLFSDAYDVSASPTLFLADPKNKIEFGETIQTKTRDAQYKTLDATLKRLL